MIIVCYTKAAKAEEIAEIANKLESDNIIPESSLEYVAKVAEFDSRQFIEIIMSARQSAPFVRVVI